MLSCSKVSVSRSARQLCCRDLDAESANPGQAIFEKLVSGLYLGEVLLLTPISG